MSVAVVVSDLGSERDAYGEYFGDGATLDYVEDRIVIYRDTLERDFGHDRTSARTSIRARGSSATASSVTG